MWEFHQQYFTVVFTLDSDPVHPQIDSREDLTAFCPKHISVYSFFWVMQISCFDQKIKNYLKSTRDRTRTLVRVESTTFVSSAAGDTTALTVCGVFLCCSEIWLFIETTDYRSNFAKTILSENCSCFWKNLSVSRWNLPGYFSVSFRFNRRRCTSPILFVSFTLPCDQYDRKIQTICKSAARWRGRRARGYRKLILRVNLLYVPNIKM